MNYTSRILKNKVQRQRQNFCGNEKNNMDKSIGPHLLLRMPNLMTKT